MCTSMIDHSSKFIFFLFIFQPPLMVLKVHWTTQRVDTVMTQIMEFQWNSGCTSASIKLVGQKSVVQFQSCVTFLLHGEDLHCFQTSFLHPCVKRHWAKWKWRYRSALLLLLLPTSTYRHKHNDIKKRSIFSLCSYVYVIMFLCSAVHTGT